MNTLSPSFLTSPICFPALGGKFLKLDLEEADASFDKDSVSTNDDQFSRESTLNNLPKSEFCPASMKNSPTKLAENEQNAFGSAKQEALASKNKRIDDPKYKTELCKNWDEKGECPYKNKCKFAHGKDELREKINKKQSKKKCAAFSKNWTCPYGTRCVYIHERRTLGEINEKFAYERFLQFPELLEDKAFRGLKRLNFFKKLDLMAHHQTSKDVNFRNERYNV